MENEKDLSPELPENGDPLAGYPTPAEFLQKEKPKFTCSYMLGEADYMAFNRFIFEDTGVLAGSRLRMRYIGIAELLAGMGCLAAALFISADRALLLLISAVFFLGGVLTMLYYPFIFPKQFEKSIHQSYEESGYMGRKLELTVYPDGIVESSSGEAAGALWEDIRGFYEMDRMYLFLMEQQQAVCIPKSAVEDPEAFAEFCGKSIERESHRGQSRSAVR